MCSRIASIAPPLPALSRPSTSTHMRAPVWATQRASCTSSRCIGSSRASYSLRLSWLMAASEAFFVNARDVAAPLAVELVEQALGGDLAAGDDLLQRFEEAGLAVARLVQPGARDEAGACDFDHLAGEVEQLAAAGDRGIERQLRHRLAQRLALGHRPVPDQVPGGVERRVVVKQPDP